MRVLVSDAHKQIHIRKKKKEGEQSVKFTEKRQSIEGDCD